MILWQEAKTFVSCRVSREKSFTLLGLNTLSRLIELLFELNTPTFTLPHTEQRSRGGAITWEVTRVVRADLQEQMKELEVRLKEEQEKRAAAEVEMEQWLREEQKKREETVELLEKRVSGVLYRYIGYRLWVCTLNLDPKYSCAILMHVNLCIAFLVFETLSITCMHTLQIYIDTVLAIRS